MCMWYARMSGSLPTYLSIMNTHIMFICFMFMLYIHNVIRLISAHYVYLWYIFSNRKCVQCAQVPT